MKRITAALFAALLLLLLPSSATAACPNEDLRIAQDATSLPGCMALEMASPPKKFSQPASQPSFSRNGERMLILIETGLPGATGYQYYGGDTYVASRGPGGWSIASTAPLDGAIAAGGAEWGNPSTFSPDLDRWAQLGSTQAQNQVGIARLYGGGLDGSFDPLSPLLVPIDDTGTNKTAQTVEDLLVLGSSTDLGVNVLEVTLASTAYLAGDPRASSVGGLNEFGNTYVAFLDEAGEPALELLARDKDGVVWGGRCRTLLGGAGGAVSGGVSLAPATFNQGAISPDGERIFFSTRPAQEFDEEKGEGPVCDLDNDVRIMKRTATPAGPVIAELIPGDPSAPGDDLFQAASADGSKVYLMSPRKLAASDTDASEGPCSGAIGASKGCDLYLYDEAKPESERAIHVSDAEGPVQADVLNSAPAISGDGSRAYFVAQGVLTSDQNPEGDTAQAGNPNLYLYEAGADSLSFIATLAADDKGSRAGGLWEVEGSFFADAYAAPLHGAAEEEGGDGHVLAFASKASVTEDDEDGGHRDAFRYDAEEETLIRISKAAAGGSDNGPYDVTVNPVPEGFKGTEHNFGEATRWASEDGQTIAFATEEALLPADADGAANPYAWHGGQLGASFASVNEPPAVSPTGTQVAFGTSAPLLPQDEDSAKDVYLAREGGGFPLPVAPTVCDPLQEGSCRQGAPAPLGPPSPATAAFSGPGNAKAPARCRKGQVKRRGKCVKKARKARKRADKRRGGSR